MHFFLFKKIFTPFYHTICDFSKKTVNSKKLKNLNILETVKFDKK